MILELCSGNFTPITLLEFVGQHVPRVGETVVLHQDVGTVKNGEEMLVFEVTYLLEGGELTPLVRCQIGFSTDNRRHYLEENGWL